ncbi:unnamed protein product [Cuscuta epithymum]|uniref:non-specific serine/threonine protein kinase n=2 Tax=Cuscuta epithymum TaxID=186058 RepID=A0AAV0DWE1_9ASTE|nr:unnamed protein product [Cuscuta epithymum]
MNVKNIRICIFVSLKLSIFSFVLLLEKSFAVDLQFVACEPKRCPHGQSISYPFYLQGQQEPYCGVPDFNISCNGQGYPILLLSENEYVVQNISYENNTFRVYNAAANQGFGASCHPHIRNWTTTGNEIFAELSLSYSSRAINLFSNCSRPLLEPLKRYEPVGCDEGGKGNTSSLVMFHDNKNLISALEHCTENVVAPVERWEDERSNDVVKYDKLLRRGFELQWRVSSCSECKGSGGRCGFNSTTQMFKCFCPDRPHSSTCKPQMGKSKTKVIIIAVLGAVILILTLSLVVFVLRSQKKGCCWGSSQFFPDNTTSDDLSLKQDLEHDSKYFGIHVFSYSELEEATNSFDSSKELGDGGFGTVYYGKLRDGREVAVKRLYEHNNKRMEQFRNEIEILTCLRHPNLVTLYGCTSRLSRELLVYEYIPNGTVADHLHGERVKDGSLTWPIRMSIAVEAAGALAYLHASGIIHRDVKTSNILLDENFCVKVADFGLSRHFPNNVSHVSTAPQGTPGYVDPEYHEFYQLTDKSDVYSFGVVLIELISSMPAVDISRHRHEINLSNLAMNRIIRHAFNELIDPFLRFETDAEILRMTTSVAELAFRCLQPEKDMRPTMDDILETLKEIQVPQRLPPTVVGGSDVRNLTPVLKHREAVSG